MKKSTIIYLLFVLLFVIAYLHSNNIGIFGHEEQFYQGTIVTSHTLITQLWFTTFVYVVYRFKHKPMCGAIWNLLVLFFTVLLLTLGINYAKGSIKEWWNKD